MASPKSVILLLLFMSMTVFTKAQFFDELSNPQVTVNIVHPPGLGLKINKVAFNNATGNCSEQINDALIQDFVNSKVDVIDRANLDAILTEHNLNASGYIDPANAVAIGKIIGPSALITAKVLRCESKRENFTGTEEKYDSKTKKKYIVKYFISRITTFLKVSIQTVDLTTGRIFSAQIFEYAPFLETKAYEGAPVAPLEFENQERAYRILTSDVHKMFFPWTEPTLLYYFDDKDGGLKLAYQALKTGDTESAFKISERNLEACKQSPATKPKILAHAFYNLGMSYLIRNEFDEAIANFQEAQKLKPGSIVSKTINDCMKAKNLLLEMQRVEDKASLEAQKSQSDSENAAKAIENNALKNADIITLTKKKLPTAIIIQKIKTSDCKFDTSTQALVELTDAGVSESVIVQMMEKK